MVSGGRYSALAFAALVVFTSANLAAPAAAITPHPASSLAPTAVASSGPSGNTDFTDDIERDFTLRSHGQLQVTNLRGDIVIQGWSLDRIRVKARRRAKASSLEEAKRLFSAVDFRFSNTEGQLELAAEYGRGLSLQERLRERVQPRTAMQMTVFAPARLKLRIWGVSGKITLKNWDAPIDVRASSGEISLDHVKSGGASVLCPDCAISVRSVRGPVRCMGESGDIRISQVEGPQIYAETTAGALSLSRIHGEQLYVTKSGRLTGRDLHGRIEFHGGSSPVEISESSGFLSGRTTSGNIIARMREWSFADKAVIESIRGDIRLSLPSDFSGEVDIFGGKGPPDVGFGVEKLEDSDRLPPGGPKGRVQGRIGDGGELLKVYSAQGHVRVVRGE